MLVSIIIPVYNVSEYIEACLESIAIQRYAEIECILIDDCGEDDSVSKIQNWIKKYNFTFFI